MQLTRARSRPESLKLGQKVDPDEDGAGFPGSERARNGRWLNATMKWSPSLRAKVVFFCVACLLLLAFGLLVARYLGREFMPPLDEGSILDMPITTPRASVTEVADDLKARDAIIRSVPEVELNVGKGGRADTPTDPSPLDMVESVINLRPREHWIKR